MLCSSETGLSCIPSTLSSLSLDWSIYYYVSILLTNDHLITFSNTIYWVSDEQWSLSHLNYQPDWNHIQHWIDVWFWTNPTDILIILELFQVLRHSNCPFWMMTYSDWSTINRTIITINGDHLLFYLNQWMNTV